MTFQEEIKAVTIETGRYRLRLEVPPMTSRITDKRTNRSYDFTAGGDCAMSGKEENCSASTPWQVSRQDGKIVCRRSEKSNLWERKETVLEAEEDSVSTYYELTGSGAVEDVRFFREVMDGDEYGFGGDCDEVFTAAPNFLERVWYYPTDRVIISNGCDLSIASGCTAIANVPAIMALHDRRDAGAFGLAAFAMPGEYDYDEFIWNPPARKPPTDYIGDQAKAGGFALTYYGKKIVSGTWTTPRLVMTFPESAEKIVATALEHAYAHGYLPRPAAKRQIPRWWMEPIYCTWHDQCALSVQDKQNYFQPMTPSQTFCTQENVEHWLQLLIDHDAKPGTVIIDDKWQISKLDGKPDPAKWPDMRGWIEHCHERGIRVFLWDTAWHTEDIPADEAITRDGKIVGGDPTNPKYEARLRRKMQRCFGNGPEDLHADGIKLDFLMSLPTGAGLKNYKNIWGLELQRYLIEILHGELKKANPEACFGLFSANPYLDEFTDMVRLADMYCYRPSTANAMRQRQALFAVTHPSVPIDTDGQLFFSRDPEYRKLLDVELEIGIPTIYNAEYLRFQRFFLPVEFRKLNEEDYAAIARVFAAHRAKLDRIFGK